MTDPTPVVAIRALARSARVLERACGELNLAQYRVLAAIAAGDERASRIADRLALGKPTVSATVESLRQRGLLTRRGVEGDQRAVALRLTAEGRAALETAERSMTERLCWLADRTGDPDGLLRVLALLDRAIDDLVLARCARPGDGTRTGEGVRSGQGATPGQGAGTDEGPGQGAETGQGVRSGQGTGTGEGATPGQEAGMGEGAGTGEPDAAVGPARAGERR